MTGENYWNRMLSARARRRAVLAASGGVGVMTALSLVGCGGSSNNNSSAASGASSATSGSSAAASGASGASGSTGASGASGASTGNGLLSLPAHTDPKQGGVLRTFMTAAPPNFDPLLGGSSIVVSGGANYTYPRLLKYKVTPYPGAATGDSEGDLAESFELSADKLQLTFKLRKGLKWDSRSPTSGREIDSSDVVFSWNKFAKSSTLRGDIAYSDKTPFAPIESVSAPDANTVIFKLHQPDASIIGYFSSPRHVSIMPKESESQFDPKSEVRGYGPYTLQKLEPSVGMTWQRNPDYYVQGRPYPDSIDVPFVPEYATALAQFRAGTIYTSVATQQDILTTKKDLAKTLLTQPQAWELSHRGFKFGYEDNSPFKDQRMRQAAVMLIDNDAFGEADTSASDFKNAGLDFPVKYNTIVAPGFEEYFMDPRDSEFGPNSKYMLYDPTEAHKLMSAAGYPNGVDTKFWFSGVRLPPAYGQAAQILSQMLTEGGIRAELAPISNYDDFINNYLYAYTAGNTKGFNGIWYVWENLAPTCVAQLFAICHKDGGRFQGMSPDGNQAWLGDPKANQMIEQMKQEFDKNKLISMVKDFTRYFHLQAYRKVNAWSTLPFQVTWPALGNWNFGQSFTGGNSVVESNLDVWVDSSKAPLA